MSDDAELEPQDELEPQEPPLADNEAALWQRLLGLQLVWALLPAILVGAGMGLMPMRSWDYWWHLSFGRLIAHYHAMPAENHFLYTMAADAPSYVQAWLSQWALFELHQALGLHGIMVMRNQIAALAFGALTYLASRRAGSIKIGALLTMAVIPLGLLCIEARSHLLAWPLFFLILPLGYAIHQRRLHPGFLVVFPLLTVLWANLHGTFLVPTLLAIAFGVAEVGHRWLGAPEHSTRRAMAWGATILASLGATLLNPRGYEIYIYLVDLPTNPENLATVTEWFPATPFFPVGYGALFWALLLLTLGLMARQRDRLDLADLFILLGFSLMAIRHSRALLWVALSWPVVAAPYFAPLAAKFKDAPAQELRKPEALVNLLICAALLAGLFALQPYSSWQLDLMTQMQIAKSRRDNPLKGVTMAETPVEEVEQIRLATGQPRVFHDHRYAGFILYQLQSVPSTQMVFLDNRVELPSAEIWKLHTLISRGDPVYRGIFKRFGVNAVIASVQYQGGLIKALRKDKGWVVGWEDEENVLFLLR